MPDMFLQRLDTADVLQPVTIKKGEPLCRIVPVRRDAYFARQMSPRSFEEFFDRGQKWLATHGKFEHEAAEGAESGRGVADITRTYVKQQVRSKFVVPLMSVAPAPSR